MLLAGSAECDAADAPCRAVPVAATTLVDNWGFLAFPATIGGVPVSLLLDTGADAGLVTADAARRLGLPLDPTLRTLVQGTGGVYGDAPGAMLRDLAIGGVTMPAMRVPVGALPSAPRIEPPAVGLVGGDLLAGLEVDIDVPAHRLALQRLAGDCRDFRPWPGAVPVPLIREGARLLVPVTLDGHPLRALVDSGARANTLDTAAAERLGVSAATLAGDPGGEAAGVDLHPLAYHWHQFRALEIGGVVLHRPVLTVSRLQEQTLLLGADFLASRRVWLSTATARMFIGPPPPAPVGAALAR